MSKSKMSVRKLGISVMFFEFLTIAGGFIAVSYINYVYTDIGHIDVATMTVAMTIVNILNTIFSLFCGVIIQKTRSMKMGKYRFFLMLGFVLDIVGGILIVFTFVQSVLIRAIIISIGYCLYNISMDLTYSSKYLLIARMGQGDSKVIDTLTGMDYGGGNLGFILYSLFFLTLVNAFGSGNEQIGFLRTGILYAALVVPGLILIMKASKPFDGEQAFEDESANVSVSDMLKGVFTNKMALAVTAGYIIKNIGYGILNFCLVYQCTYVFANMNLMSFLLAGVSISGAIGGFIAPSVISRLGGRKRAVVFSCTIAAILYIIIAFTGENPIVFSILICMGMLIQSIADSVEGMMYMDTGEYWYHKTGNDTRPFVVGMYGIAGKISSIITTPVIAIVLSLCHFTEGSVMIGQDARTMTAAIGLIPAGTLIMFLVILLLFHRVSDSEIERCIAENAAKDSISA